MKINILIFIFIFMEKCVQTIDKVLFRKITPVSILYSMICPLRYGREFNGSYPSQVRKKSAYHKYIMSVTASDLKGKH